MARRYRKSKARLLGDLFGRSSIFTSQVNETTSEVEVKFDERANILTTDADDLIGYLPKSGGTMTGNLTLFGAPSSELHAATKAYVDENSGSGVALGDLSATTLDPSGTGTLAYNNSTGAFSLTPPDLSSYHKTNSDVWNAFTFGGNMTFLEGALNVTNATIWNAFTFGDGLSFSEGTLTSTATGSGNASTSVVAAVANLPAEPSEGDMAYVSANKSFYVYDGSSWVNTTIDRTFWLVRAGSFTGPLTGEKVFTPDQTVSFQTMVATIDTAVDATLSFAIVKNGTTLQQFSIPSGQTTATSSFTTNTVTALDEITLNIVEGSATNLSVKVVYV